jgi:adenylosuccinate synthase
LFYSGCADRCLSTLIKLKNHGFSSVFAKRFFSKTAEGCGILFLDKNAREYQRMEPLFSEKQLQNMSKENIIELMQAMQAYQKKQEDKIRLLVSA